MNEYSFNPEYASPIRPSRYDTDYPGRDRIASDIEAIPETPVLEVVIGIIGDKIKIARQDLTAVASLLIPTGKGSSSEVVEDLHPDTPLVKASSELNVKPPKKNVVFDLEALNAPPAYEPQTPADAEALSYVDKASPPRTVPGATIEVFGHELRGQVVIHPSE